MQTAVSGRGHSVKSIIDPTSCINMHHHYCWGFVPDVDRRNHDVEPDVAVLQHYKRCHLSADRCRQMMNDSASDDTILKFRTELTRAVSQKLSRLSLL